MKFPRLVPFIEMLGFELLRFEDGESEVAVEVRADFTNSWDVAHGGLTMTLLDVAMAHAARAPAAPGGSSSSPGVVTIEMKTTFMRPGLGRLCAKARRLHSTASLAFCEGSVFDAQGLLIAQGSGTFKYLHGLPAGRRKIQRQEATSSD